MKSAKVITLHANDLHAENTLKNKDAVKPVESSLDVSDNVVNITIPAKSFVVYRF